MVVFRARVRDSYATTSSDQARAVVSTIVDRWLRTTESGAWVREHKTSEIRVEHMSDVQTLDLLMAAMTQMTPENETFYRLKFGEVNQDIEI